MAGPTDVTPSDVRASGREHINTRESIKSIEDRVTGSVEFLTNSNAGDLMKRLSDIQKDWTVEMEKVQTKLVEMAEYMETAAKSLEARNASHAGDLRD